MWGDGGTYAQWAKFLEDWSDEKAGLDAIPNALEQADFAEHTWVRLLTRVQDSVQKRLDRWNAQLTRALAATSDEFTIGRALTQARGGCRAIRELCLQPGLPEELRTRLIAQIDQQIRSVQTSMEQQAMDLRRSGDYNASEMLLRVVRDNRLDVVTTPNGPTTADWFTSGVPARRRVIPD
jgi:hypothetical protein